MTKRQQIASLAAEAGVTYIHYPKGRHPQKKSAVWEFKLDSVTVAEFTSPGRAIQWLEMRTGKTRTDEGRQS